MTPSFYKRIPLFAIVLGVLLGISCQEQSPHYEGLSISTTPPKNSLNQTAAMVDSLERIYQSLEFFKHPYASNESLRAMKAKMGNRDLSQFAPQMQFEIALVHLQAGKSEEASKILEDCIRTSKIVPGKLSGENLLFDMLAATYLRTAELKNCVKNHNEYSCIVPLHEKAVHEEKQFAEKAIEIYDELIKLEPNKLSYKWLINIAYMTLGKYPQDVPKAQLIPESVFKSDYALPRFENIAMKTGLDLNDISGASIVDDFNGDGFKDVLASSYDFRHQIRLFLGSSNGSFKEQTKEAGLNGLFSGLNIKSTDFNNDGHLDFLVLRGGWRSSKSGLMPNSLVRNNGDGTFTDVTISAGLYSIHPTQTATWADFDLDGDLDLFIGNESSKEPHPCEFYLNNGDETFSEISSQLNLGITSFVKGVNSGDLNNDGRPDIYISNLKGNNLLLLNEKSSDSHGFKFTDVAPSAGVTEPLESFPTWFFDFDNDGWEDILVTCYDKLSFSDQAGQTAAAYLKEPFEADVPRLYRNLGNGKFADVTKEMNLAEPLFAMGCNYGDLDNDGFLDFYLGTGAPDFRAIVPNRMYRNNAGKNFQDVTTSGGFGIIQKGHGVSFSDLDNDGDQDVYTVLGGAYQGDNFQNALFENPGNSNDWIVLRLEGVRSNLKAIGARVRLDVRNGGGEVRQIFNTVSDGASFGSNSLDLEIGLGPEAVIEKLSVNWPNGDNAYEEFSALKNGKAFLIKEGAGVSKEFSYQAIEFQETSGGHHHHH